MQSKRSFMYQPFRGDPVRGELTSADLLPVELMQIAGVALQKGWQVDLIDAVLEKHPHQKHLAACTDAATFGSSCILGYAVWTSQAAAR